VTEPVNLNRFRKARARADAQFRAAENRVRFGLTKAQKVQARDSQARAEAAVDAHKREP
jgi:hypothetical protein